MSLADALVADLTPEALEDLAARLAPLLVARLTDGAPDQGWLRGADQIAEYIGAPRSRVYALASAGRIPVVRDGSALLAKRAELDAWIRHGGGRRP